MDNLAQFFTQLFGIGANADSLNIYQMGLRAVLIYAAALVMVRLGDKRFLGKNTAFDLILGIILGSVVSRGINGSAALLPTVVSGFVLVGLHFLFAALAFRTDRLGSWIKGEKRRLIHNGEIEWNQMAKSHISKNDLLSQLRSSEGTGSLERVEEAYLERSGDISFILKDRPRAAQVVEVSVAEGVQTVRIRIE